MGRIARGAAALALLLPPVRAAAQEAALARAMDMEQQGQWTRAAVAYVAALRQEPGNAIALLGLERVAEQAGWRDSAVAYAERAIGADSTNTTARAVEVRALRALGRDTLAAAALARWVAVEPRSPMPYREWAQLDLAAGRAAAARDVVALARERLGSPTALAPEMARVEIAAGQWTRAAAEWRVGVDVGPQYTDAAAFSLRPAPVAARGGVLAALMAPGYGASSARRLAADLLLGWNEPGRAWSLLRSELPPAGPRQSDALRTFADRARTLDGPGAQHAAAEAYEMLAQREPPPEAVGTRIESARAYAAAGDAAAAQRVLRPLLEDAGADSAARSSALAAMIELQVRAGDPAAASQLLEASAATLSGSQREQLGQRIAAGWLRRGDLARAAAALGGDSSLGALEVRGWVALYGGRLAEGREALRSTGAMAGEAGGAAARAATVALLDAVGRDSLPALGAALLLAVRGDSLAAARALVRVARQVGGDGEPALLAWAARYAAAGGDIAAAEAQWREIADRFPTSGQAAGAELALARSLASRGDLQGARDRLEAMILAHPESALVPEARRELDRVRGMVP
jgi:tetratricopeptide (TPR) repeat protein